MKHPQQLKTAPLNRAADLLAEKGSSFSDKTARQINAPFIPEIHMVGGPEGVDAIGELFRACGWLVLYHPRKDNYAKTKRGETSVLGHRNKPKHSPKLARRSKSKH